MLLKPYIRQWVREQCNSRAMNDSTLQPVIDQIAALYQGELGASDCVEAARRLTDFVGLLLEIESENRGAA